MYAALVIIPYFEHELIKHDAWGFNKKNIRFLQLEIFLFTQGMKKERKAGKKFTLFFLQNIFLYILLFIQVKYGFSFHRRRCRLLLFLLFRHLI
jgi:hypothetical protein